MGEGLRVLEGEGEGEGEGEALSNTAARNASLF